MKKTMSTVAVLCAALANSLQAQAADTVHMLPIAQAMDANNARERLGDSVKFYFGNQDTPHILSKLGSDKTSQKTNSVGKSFDTSCNWAFLSAMLALQKHANAIGANAVVNIVSNYKNVEHSSATEFECHDGMLMTGVALKADFVKIDSK